LGLIVVNREHLKEFFSAPDDELNFLEGTNTRNDFETPFRAGGNRLDYHIGVVRTQLTQNLGNLMPLIADELNNALTDELEPLLTNGKSKIYPVSNK
jgi:hypothetical protein